MKKPASFILTALVTATALFSVPQLRAEEVKETTPKVTEPAPAPAPAKPGETAPAAKPYTLETCLVSDEKLDSMGKPYVFVHEGQEIKMCCKSCLKDFNKEPAKFLKKLEEKSKEVK